jgi:hypothetical protein
MRHGAESMEQRA